MSCNLFGEGIDIMLWKVGIVTGGVQQLTGQQKANTGSEAGISPARQSVLRECQRTTAHRRVVFGIRAGRMMWPHRRPGN